MRERVLPAAARAHAVRRAVVSPSRSKVRQPPEKNLANRVSRLHEMVARYAIPQNAPERGVSAKNEGEKVSSFCSTLPPSTAHAERFAALFRTAASPRASSTNANNKLAEKSVRRASERASRSAFNARGGIAAPAHRPLRWQREPPARIGRRRRRSLAAEARGERRLRWRAAR
eukprot:5415644-Pleurochrysis_carterae.AAC.1